MKLLTRGEIEGLLKSLRNQSALVGSLINRDLYFFRSHDSLSEGLRDIAHTVDVLRRHLYVLQIEGEGN